MGTRVATVSSPRAQFTASPTKGLAPLTVKFANRSIGGLLGWDFDGDGTVGEGGALAYADGFVYALRGGGNNDFWRYTISADKWQRLADAPKNIYRGAALASDGGDSIYAFRGNGKDDFWKYTISTRTWTTLDDDPGDVQEGGALVHVDGFVYAFRGGARDDFWRYDISADDWQSLVDAPSNVGRGAALTSDGGDSIYALRGNGTDDFWRHIISTDTWTALNDAPGDVR